MRFHCNCFLNSREIITQWMYKFAEYRMYMCIISITTDHALCVCNENQLLLYATCEVNEILQIHYDNLMAFTTSGS